MADPTTVYIVVKNYHGYRDDGVNPNEPTPEIVLITTAAQTAVTAASANFDSIIFTATQYQPVG